MITALHCLRIRLLWLPLVATVVTTESCEAERGESPQIAATRESLLDRLDAMKVFKKGGRPGERVLELGTLSPRDSYLVKADQRGLAALDASASREFSEPTILSAVVERTDENQIALVISWLSSTVSTGVYIQNDKHTLIAEGSMYTPFDGEEVDKRSTLSQFGMVRISPDGNQDIPRLQVDTSELTHNVWVGLIQKDGSRTKPIQAFVDKTALPDGQSTGDNETRVN
jgi:hypothetical protein